MHTFLDAKTMAKALRAALAERQIDLSHSDSLELVARQFGFDNWNILAARIEAARNPADLRSLFDEWYHAIVSSRNGRREAEHLRGKLLEVI